ncbi:hypothetical protein [Endozoicomonas sp. ISHI1]|uniref:hypothetical protein n=1 Tax=Endozoicomonas sp. ISHI1 TaxID=2825882 RepID=UPI002147FF71|nr:hypothetical protein [Endozoicomonas sp. ISHI1]
MKKSFNLFPLLLCLFYSTAQASLPPQNDFDFLEPFNNNALVANGPELTKSIAGLSVSTLLNLGIWWGVCKTAGTVTGLSNTDNLAETDTGELENSQTDFCLQLASVMTAAEVALAGQVSPWPMERWWKPLYSAGAGMAAYVAIAQTRELVPVPVPVLTYFASAAVTRTIASTMSVLILRKMNARDITTEWYATGKYVLSALSMVIAGSVAYEAMVHKGLNPTKGGLASVVSAAILVTLSRIISGLIIDVDGQIKTRALGRVVAETIYLAAVTALVSAGATAVNIIGAETGAQSGVPSLSGSVASIGALVGALVGSVAGLREGAEVKDESEPGVLVGVVATALGGVGTLLMLGRSQITSNNPVIQAGVTMAPALAFAVINSFSNYAVYGYPLEQSFSETGWTQWKKFYAPLDYFSTLFK